MSKASQTSWRQFIPQGVRRHVIYWLERCLYSELDMHLCMWSLLLWPCAREVVGFSTSLTSTPRCDPIWSSAVRRVWAKAAGIGLTCECAYGQFTNDLLPSSYIFLSQDRHACVMYGRVSCAGRFVPVWFSMRVFLGKRARCSTNSSAVHFRGLVNIYDRVFPLTQARLLGSAGVATHTSHCKALR